jgi:hypothetical protein
MNESEPRLACAQFFFERNLKPKLLTKTAFDKLCGDDIFMEGPFAEAFGDRPPEPYNPFRQAWGVLKNGTAVYCELHPSRQPPEPLPEPPPVQGPSVWERLRDKD